jgi:two-component system OmpR family response regulator
MTAVLVIDDDETARLVVRDTLQQAGFTVHTSATPIGATRLVREHGVSVVVCDLNMPAMRGDALARLFRGSKALQHVRLVLISGAGQDQLDAIARDGVVDAALSKDALAQALVPTLHRLVRR